MGEIGSEWRDVRVTFVVDRVWVRDGEETGIDLEGRVFFDGDGLALIEDERGWVGVGGGLTFWLSGT